MDAQLDRSPGGHAGLLFAEDFDLPPSPDATRAETPAPGPGAAELEAARAQAWREGHAVGHAEARAAHDAAMREAARSVTAQLAAVRTEAGRAAEIGAEAVARLLLDTLAALFPTLCARHGEAEARAVARAILPGVAQEPAVTLHANPSIVAALGEELDRFDPEFATRARIISSEMIAPGDVRITWSHGAAVRDSVALWDAVAAALAPTGLLGAEAAAERELTHAG